MVNSQTSHGLGLTPGATGRIAKFLTFLLIISGLSLVADAGWVSKAQASNPTPVLLLDPGNQASYVGSGTTWNDISGSGYTLGASPSSTFPTYSASNGGVFNFTASSLQGAATTGNFGAVSTFTAEAFFKLSAWPTADRTAIVTTQYGGGGIVGPTLYVSSGGKLDGGYFDGSYWRTAYGDDNVIPAPGYQLSLNTWYAAGVTFDGTNVRLYVNNSLVSTSTENLSGTSSSRAAQLRIGTRWDGDGSSSVYTTGSIGVVKVYNSALSAAQISTDYTTYSGRYFPQTSVTGSGSNASACNQTGSNLGNGSTDVTAVGTTGGYCVVTFTNPNISYSWTVPTGVSAAQLLIIGGGGAGGGGIGGGGGGGEFVPIASQSVTGGSAISITVGAGGTSANNWTSGHAGSSSSFGSITAYGGGGGGTNSSNPAVASGGPGFGSQGGNGYDTTPTNSVATRSDGVTGYRNNGGGGSGGSSDNATAGGGGGAGGAGGAGTTSTGSPAETGGAGGAGKSSSITGTATYYAAGGGGGINGAALTATGSVGASSGNPGVGGSSIGGNGGAKANAANGSNYGNRGDGTNGTVNSNGTAGAANTGSGGGGASNWISGGAGGSGVVIISYPMPPSFSTATISGTAQVGVSLTATASTITGAATTTTYQWQNSATANGTFAAISGATSATYTPTSTDFGKFLEVVITVTNSSGSATQTSSATAAVLAQSVTGTGTNASSCNQSGTNLGNGTSTDITAVGTAAGYCVVSFLNPAVAYSWYVPTGVTSASILVVGGGGGGGYNSGGGGSGGGVTSLTNQTLSNSSYSISVGAGGNGANYTNSTNGMNGSTSAFGATTAAGGNFGSNYVSNMTTDPAGGSAVSGGGVGGNGVHSSSESGGAGGNGTQSSITGTATYYGGGGGGGGWYPNTSGGGGGSGGGGAGSGTSGSAGAAGTANTGGGGGASSTHVNGGAGGSGVVIISYPMAPSFSTATISGTAQVGSQLTATASTITGATTTTTYQWQSSTTSGGTYSNISGATSSTYTPVAADYGNYIKVVITITNTSGSATQTSSATAAVTAGAPTVTGVSPAYGSTGGTTSVTITGTNFLGVTAVKFGTSNATSYVVNSSTSITAVAPAQSYSNVDITVTTANSTSATSSADSYQYALTSVGASGPNASACTQSGSSLGATSSDISVSGIASGYCVIQFLNPNIPYSWTVPSGVTSASILVVGGGGSGGNRGGGGGNAGGVYYGTTSLTQGQSTSITVGLGGTGLTTSASNNTSGNAGGSSSFGAVTESGGAAGMGGGTTTTSQYSSGSGSINGTPYSGYQEGNGGYNGSNVAAGGGAGAQSAGGDYGSVTAAGNGGSGYSSTITGSAVCYAGGGGGGYGQNSGTAGTGGTCSGATSGAGAGSNSSGTSGVNASANTGSGGGGGSFLNSTNGATGAGGSGIVIVSYPMAPSFSTATISGTAQVGSTLTATASTITGATTTTTYQWQSSTTSGGTYSNISGATSSTYTPVAADYGKFIKAVITVTNTSGSATQTSTATAAVIAGAPTVTGVSPAYGSTGGTTSVTITGTNFLGVTAVKFGSTNATSYVVNSSTSITAVAPAQSYSSVDITVTTANSTSATSSADNYQYALTSVIATGPNASACTQSGSSLGATSSDISVSGIASGYCVIQFLNPNIPYSWTVPSGVTSAEILEVGGGGAGGMRGGGGGGAGGYVDKTGVTLSPSTNIGVTVGSGGVGSNVYNTPGGTGANSQVVIPAGSPYIAYGGGGGGTANANSDTVRSGQSGGSSGGSTGNQGGNGGASVPDATQPSSASGGYGNKGGTGGNPSNYGNWPAGGGGGAGSAGSTPADNSHGGAGGSGQASSITGTSVCYATGGGGGINTGNTGGVAGTCTGFSASINGGNGTSGVTPPTTPTLNTGSGGGGVGYGNGTDIAGANGASGIVIIAYPIAPANGTATISGSTTVGSTFTASTNTAAASATSYQWTESSSSTGTYTALTGATNSTYVLTSSDYGKYLEVQITLTNSSGSGTQTSSATSAISASAPTVTSVSPASGLPAGGTSVVITGTNFYGVSSVSFGGTASGTVVVNSPTQITATSPAHSAGSVDVTVTTATSTSATSSADTFLYAVTSASAGGSNASACSQTGSNLGGSSSDFQAFGTSSGWCVVDFLNPNISYSWTPPTGVTALTPIIVGGGGGGGGGAAGSALGAGGGGAAGLVSTSVITLSSSSPLAISVGSGGAAGTTSGTTPGSGVTAGGSGGTTTVTQGVTTLASIAGGTGGGAGGVAGTGTCANLSGDGGGNSTYPTTAPQSTYINHNDGACGDGQNGSVTPSIANAGTNQSNWDGGGGGSGAGGYAGYAQDIGGQGGTGGNGGVGVTNSTINLFAPIIGIGDLESSNYYFGGGGGGGGTPPTNGNPSASSGCDTSANHINSSVADCGEGGPGGYGGGGTGGFSYTGAGATSATSNTGGGGGGGGWLYADNTTNISGKNGASGAAGIVVLAYPIAPSYGTASISGTPTVGSTLTASTSTIGATSTTYQWIESSSSSGPFTSISGATSSTYVLAPSDYNKYLEVQMAVTNTSGSATETSTATSVVTAGAPTVTGVAPTVGSTAGGTSVTITGTNFLGVTSVKFGSANATSYVVNSSTSITAVAPSQSYSSVDTTVTTANSTSATSSSDKFQYAAISASGTGTNGSACSQTGNNLGSGTSTDITVVGNSNGYCVISFLNPSVPYSWTVPTNVSSLSVLVVGGGGGGAASETGYQSGGGGGGGGGVYPATSVPVSGNISISVGAGGAGGTSSATPGNTVGSRGGASAFSTLTAGGGGGGGCNTNAAQGACPQTNTQSGGNGTAAGNGGGATNFWAAYTYGAAGTASSVTISPTTFPAISGFNGGVYVAGSSPTYASAGGGGATGAGTWNSVGPGYTSSITGTSAVYGAGGGAYGVTGWSFGAATGIGTGGSGAYSTSGTGANGASGTNGVVIVSYPIAPSYGTASIGGTTTVGSTLTASTNTAAATSTTYQWVESSSSSGPFTSISGATNATYTLVPADYSKYLEVQITLTNTSGTATQTSAVTSQIAAGIVSTTSITLTAPVAGATPQTTIADNNQFHGTVSWSPSVSSTFAGATQYTATITLTADSGYTFSGIGANFFTITGATVTNSANSGTVTAVFTTTASQDATLSALTLSSGTLSPSFASATTSYSATVAYSVTSITVTPTVNQSNATVKVNGTAVTSGSASGAISLAAGNNTITVIVKAQDGVTTGTYTLTVTRQSTPTVTGISPAAGPLTAGTSVTITGTNFTAGSTVTFGANAATSVTYTSATSLTVTAPAGTAGVVDVVVTTAGGTSTTSSSDKYTYTAAPTVSTLSSNAGPLAGGGTITITGTNFTSGSTVKFGTTASGSVTYVSATSLTATVPSGLAGTVDVVVTAVGGPSATGSADQYTYTAAPTVSAVSIVGTQQFGTQLSVSATTSGSITSTTYQWQSSTSQNGSYSNISGATNSTYTPVSGDIGNYLKVVVTVTGAGGSNSASATPGSSAVAALGALTPTFGTPTATSDGFTVQISDYSSSYTWAGTATANGSVAINSTGLVTVTGVAPGMASTATITTTRTGYTSGSATVSGTSITGSALTPTFGTPTATSDGFTVSVTNYNSSYTWAAPTVSAGLVSVGTPSSSTELLTVTGLAPGTSATITVTTSRVGYNSGSATVTGSSNLSSDTTLSSLAISSGTLSPAFASATANYSVTVANNVSSITITPTVHQINATVEAKVGSNNYSSISSGYASGALALSVGQNTVTILVQAQDGTTTGTYTITVTRSASSDDTLSGLTISLGTLSPAFSSGTTAYTVAEANSVSAVTVTPTANQAYATLKVKVGSGSYATVNSGTASSSLSLAVGANTISIQVTAQDNSTVQTYTIVATVSPPSHSVTYNLGSGTGTLPTQTAVTEGLTFQVSSGTGLTYPGYTFSGWNDGANNYLAGATYTMSTSSVILTAVWTPTQQTVTYLPGTGATGTAPTHSPVATVATFTTAANTFTRTGYDFAGWSDGTRTYAAGVSYTMGINNLTLTATWTPQVYVVTYNSNSATGSASRTTDSYTYGTPAINLPTVGSMVLTGYTFGGWSTTNSGSAIPGAYTPVATITLHAVWVPNVYSVAFNINGATGTVPTTQSYTVGTAALGLSNGSGLNYPGYSFSGWSDDTNTYTSSYTPTSSLTLYAVWTPIPYAISYNLNGGTSTQPATTHQTIGTTFTVAAAALQSGYEFAGWSFNGNTYSAGSTFTVGTTDIAFTAVWIPIYTVHYVMNGSLATPVGDQGYASGTHVNVAAAPTRDGYNFGGWLDQNGVTYSAGQSFAVIENSTLSAIWNAIPYSVGYSLNSAPGTAPIQSSVTIGSVFTLAAAPTWAGYTFAGWYDGIITYGAGSAYVTGDSNISLTAQWTPINYTVTYDLAGGTSAVPSSLVKNVGQGFSVPTAPTRAGWIFDGWNDGTNTYSAGQSYTMPANNVVLTALYHAPLPAIGALSVVSGPVTGGTALTITGSNFTLVTGVTVGGNAATFTITSDTSLSISTPAGTSGAKDVVVTATGGAATLSGGFTYSLLTQTPLTITSPNGTAGTAVALTTSGGSGTGAVTYLTITSGCTTTNIGGVDYVYAAHPASCVVQATKAADSTYASLSSTATIVFDFIPTTFSLSLPANQVFANFNVATTLSATSNTAGSVTFKDSTSNISQCLNIATSGNIATCSYIPTPLGSHTLSAVFTPTNSTDYESATASVAINVLASSLSGLNPSDLTLLGSATSVANSSSGFTRATTDTTLTVAIPANSLPAGSTVNLYLDANSSSIQGLLGQSNYLLDSILSWNAPDGSIPTASVPISLTIANTGINKGMVVYGIVGGVSTPLGTATTNGSVTVYLTQDPMIVVAPTVPDAPTSVLASNGQNQSSIVSWLAPANNGGEPITSYTVTSSQGDTCISATTSCTFSAANGDPLLNGTTYTFTVTATNIVGRSSSSSQSPAITPVGPPSISTPSQGLVATYGVPYSLTLHASGAAQIQSFAVTTGSLPAGLSIDSSGHISGTPTTTGSHTVVVTATDANLQTADSAPFTITVVQETMSATLSLTPTTVPSTGTAYTATITPTFSATGQTANFSAPAADSGVVSYSATSGTANSCSVSGTSSLTLTASSAGTCLITATEAADSNYQAVTTTAVVVTFTKKIQTPIVITTTSGLVNTPLTISSTTGDAPVSLTYSATGAGCSFTGSALTNTQVNTSCQIVVTNPGDDFYAPESSTATISFGQIPLSSPSGITITAPSATSLSVVFTGDTNGTTTINVYSASTGGSPLAQSIAGVTTSPATITGLLPNTAYYIGLVSAGSGNYVSSSESARVMATTLMGAATPVVTITPSTRSVTLGQSVTLTANVTTGDAGTLSYQWSNSIGVIAGQIASQYSFTPTSTAQAGDYSVAVTNALHGTSVTDTATAHVSIAGALTFVAPGSGLTGVVGTPYTLSISGGVNGGAGSYTYSLNAPGATQLSALGLTFNTGTAVVSGTPTAAGSATFIATVTDANNLSESITATIVISAGSQNLAFTLTSSSAVSNGTSFSAAVTPTLTSAGLGTGALTYSVSSGCGIASATDIETITATSAGTCTVTATKAADANYQAATATATFTFTQATQASIAISTTSGFVGVSTPITFSGGSGSGSVTYSVTGTYCSVTGNHVTASQSTTCTVTVAKAADTYYLAASGSGTIGFGVTTLNVPTSISVTGTSSSSVRVTFVADGRGSTQLDIYDTTTATSPVQTISNFVSGGSVSGLASSTTYYVGLTTLSLDTNTYAPSVQSARVAGATLAAAGAPILAALPASLAGTVGIPETLTVSATATGGTLAYQWYQNGTALSGATNANYYFTPISSAASGNYNVVVTQTLNGSTATANSTTEVVTIAGPVVIATPSAGLSATIGYVYSLQLVAAGGTSPLTYNIASGAADLAASGLALNSSTGVISGTPIETGTVSVAVSVTDALFASATSGIFTITILDDPDAITPTFDTPVQTSSGFTVNVTNYDASYTETAQVSVGSITNSIPQGSTWLLTVTGLSSGQSATITVTTSRTGYVSKNASVVGSALTVQPGIVLTPSGNNGVAAAIPTGYRQVLSNEVHVLHGALSFDTTTVSSTVTFTPITDPVAPAQTPFTITGAVQIVDIVQSGLTGSIQVCLDGGANDHLWHFTGGVWVDITASHTSTQVCGFTTTFSPFAVGAPVTPNTITPPSYFVASSPVKIALSGNTFTFTAATLEFSYHGGPLHPAVLNNEVINLMGNGKILVSLNGIADTGTVTVDTVTAGVLYTFQELVSEKDAADTFDSHNFSTEYALSQNDRVVNQNLEKQYFASISQALADHQSAVAQLAQMRAAQPKMPTSFFDAKSAELTKQWHATQDAAALTRQQAIDALRLSDIATLRNDGISILIP